MAHRIVSRSRWRLGYSWLAAMTTASDFSRSWVRFSSDKIEHPSVIVLQNLASRLRDPGKSRTLRATSMPELEKSSSESEEKRLRSELASELCTRYQNLPPLKLPISDSCERAAILLFLALECSPTDGDLASAIESFKRSTEGSDSISTRLHSAVLSHLRRAATPVFEDLLEFVLRQNTIHGMEFLNSLRTDLLQLLRWMKSMASDDVNLPQLKDLDAYLLRILSIWFSPGIIELKRITYETTSASIIEAIAKKEAVHPMRSLDDLRSRLGPGRRVFSLFHPVLPDKPLVFVHAALLDDIPAGMNEVMEIHPNQQPKAAAFYSISNAQPGLAGVGLGEYLLKESIQRLKAEFPTLDTFVTLSPIPGFRKWLEDKIRNNLEEGGHFYDDSIITQEELDLLAQAGLVDRNSPWQSSLSMLESLDFSNPETSSTNHVVLVQPILMRLASRYLLLEKHRRKPLDAVTRFHVGNGALVHRINYAADLTRKGIKSSFGIMVNYRYDLDCVAENQMRYEMEYTVPSEKHMEEWLQATLAPHSKL